MARTLKLVKSGIDVPKTTGPPVDDLDGAAFPQQRLGRRRIYPMPGLRRQVFVPVGVERPGRAQHAIPAVNFFASRRPVLHVPPSYRPRLQRNTAATYYPVLTFKKARRIAGGSPRWPAGAGPLLTE